MKKLSIVIAIAILALCASCTLDPTEVLTISPMGGTVENGTQVSITTSVSDAQIRYTLDGTDPKYGSALYGAPVNITKNTVLKVAVFREKRRLSKVVTVEFFVKAAAPTSSVVSGTYGTSQTLTLSSTTQNATIYYTLDGTTPTTSSDVYSDTITLASILPDTKTLKMIAVASDYLCSDVAEYTYTLYTIGPAGGIVFYDCDADNDETNNGAGPDKLKSTDCNWRYLEAAPEDISVGGTYSFAFGFYRTTPTGPNLYTNGQTTYVAGTSDPNDGKCTSRAMGTGQANTTKLVNKMGDSAYTQKTGDETTANYAAKLCDDYTCGGYDDWFLPSIPELNAMIRVLYDLSCPGFGPTDYYYSYWSSSEHDYNAENVSYASVHGVGNGRNGTSRVRAVRAFLSFEED